MKVVGECTDLVHLIPTLKGFLDEVFLMLQIHFFASSLVGIRSRIWSLESDSKLNSVGFAQQCNGKKVLQFRSCHKNSACRHLVGARFCPTFPKNIITNFVFHLFSFVISLYDTLTVHLSCCIS